MPGAVKNVEQNDGIISGERFQGFGAFPENVTFVVALRSRRPRTGDLSIAGA